MNKSDSERVRTVIEQLGYNWTEQEEQAALIGILACSVRQKAIDKVYSRIHKWNKSKKNRNLLTFLTGCVLPADRKKLLKLFDFVFEMEELPDLEYMIRQYGVVTPVGHRNHLEASRKTMSALEISGKLILPTIQNLKLTSQYRTVAINFVHFALYHIHAEERFQDPQKKSLTK